MVPCRLYEQVHHSFVATEQERGLKDQRQPYENCHLDPRHMNLVVKLTMSTGCMKCRMQRCRGLVKAAVYELGFSE